MVLGGNHLQCYGWSGGTDFGGGPILGGTIIVWQCHRTVSIVSLWHYCHRSGGNSHGLWRNPPTLKKKKKKHWKDFVARWMWWLAICVCKARLSGLECLWVNWKGREPSWKTGVITQLSGKGTVESWLFGLEGSARFNASGSVCNLAPF